MAEAPYPLADDHYAITENFSIDLRGKTFYRRMDGEDLVLWSTEAPRITIFILAYDYPDASSVTQYAAETLLDEASRPALLRFDEEVNSLRFTGYYLIDTDEDGKKTPSHQAHVWGKSGFLMMAFYFDDLEDLDTVRSLWRKISEH